MAEQNFDTAAGAAEEQKSCVSIAGWSLSHGRTLSRIPRGLPSALKVPRNVGERHGVEDAIEGYRATKSYLKSREFAAGFFVLVQLN